MHPVTLYFAASQQQRCYFEKLAKAQQPGSRVVWYKQIVRPAVLQMLRAIALPEVWTITRQDLKRQALGFRCYTWGRLCMLALAGARYLTALWLYSSYWRYLQQHRPLACVLWNGLKFRQSIWALAARQQQIPVVYCENGLLKGCTTFDAQGVNYGNSLPRDPAFFRRYAKAAKIEPLVTRYRFPDSVPQATDHWLLVLQIDSDSQIAQFSPWVRNMAHLIRMVCDQMQRPELRSTGLWIKPHPLSRKRYLSTLWAGLNTIEWTQQPIETLLSQAKAVITINSTVGLEAIIANKPVICLGQAFYALPGLALSAGNEAQLQQQMQRIMQGYRLDPELRLGLLHYLWQVYQVPGDWRTADAAHIHAVTERLQQMQCLAFGNPLL